MEIQIIDYILVFILAIALPAYGTWAHRRLLQELDAGQTGARFKAYIYTIIIEWAMSLIVLAWWFYAGRSFHDLGLGLERDPGWKIGASITLAACGLLVLQTVVVLRSKKKTEGARGQVEPLQAVLPHDSRELHTFYALSLTAGICEELLYRGFIFVYLHSVFGVIPAVILSSLVFAVGHTYQGLSGILKTATVGLIMAGLLLLTGSLWAPMLLHAVLDVNSGYLAYRILQLDFERGGIPHGNSDRQEQ